MSPTCSAKSGDDGFGLLQHRHLGAQAADCASARSCRTAAGQSRRRRRAIGWAASALACASPVLDRLPAPLSGPADAEVDAAGVERVEHSEALDDRDRRRLPELHRCRADTNPVGGGGDLTDQHRGRRAGDRDEVMLGDPVALDIPTVRRAGRGRPYCAAPLRRRSLR